ncbi:hypothetical protein ScalyP_jg5006 [Parmales sp. scaly parma]|nr:hypothetical protein ScalyP_jg5006 [Parmales sp. scaly parma]
MNAQTDTATMTTWGGCNDPRYSSSRLIERGEPTAVCVVLSPPYNWNSTTSFPYQRYMLNLVADEYTSIIIPPETEYESMHVESGVELSFIRKIRIPLGAGGGGGAVKPLFFPVWTAIITVDDGAITGVVWDLACTQCSSGQCLQNMYDFNGKSVRAENSDGCGVTGCGEGGEGACGLSVFVVWSGTDVNGKVLTSNDKRSSLFPEQSLNWDALQLK